MKSPITKQALEQLLDEQPPEIVAQYVADFDDEARAHYEAFQLLVADLDRLPQDMEALTAPPAFNPEHANVVAFPQRRIGVPMWAMPLAAAALITLGFFIPRSQPADLAPLDNTRSVVQPSTTEHSGFASHDMAIASSLMNRAMKFQETREFERAWGDYRKALDYLPIDAIGDREMLKEQLKILAEEMKDPALLEFVANLK